MPDITMCKGNGCAEEIKTNCYRYMAIPCDRQSWFVAAPIMDDDMDECTYFVEVDRVKD